MPKWAAALGIVAMAAGILGAFAVAPAEAQSRTCRQLEARLVAPARGSTGQARRHDRAIEAQRGHLRTAEQNARAAGCTGFALFRQGGRSCSALNGSIERMRQNLQMLESERARMGDRGWDRERILAALEANGCREPRSREAQRRVVPEGLREQPAGRRIVERPLPQQRGVIVNDGRQRVVLGGPDNIPRAGSFRTLCVRTCDGYFFPISAGASSLDFARDEDSCRAMCPGTEVALYVHRFPGEESEQMISVSGAPYTELPSAFRYRQTGFVRPPGCECTRHQQGERGFSIMAGEPPRGTPEAAPTTETKEAATVEAVVETPLAPPARAPAPSSSGEDDADRRVRVVGPTFLPDPEAAIDLTAPARRDVP